MSNLLTVCVPVRDRSGQRLINNLATLSQANMEIVVVNYGSNVEHTKSINEIATSYHASIINVPYLGMWNKSHALNIALRACTTQYFMSTDVDMVYKPNFIAQVLAHLNSYSFISCQCKYLLDNYTKILKPPIDWVTIDKAIAGMSKSGAVGACFAVETKWLQKVRGWDQFYQGWGREDIDIATRAQQDGLQQTWITGVTSFYHQYHDDEPTKQLKVQIEENDQHYYALQSSKTILRNDEHWGTV